MIRLPWADIGYACDMAWWQRYHGQAQQRLKLTVDKAACRRFPDLIPIGLNKGSDKLELMKPGTVGWAGNSGFHCLNLAVQFQAAKIILVGFDMTIAHGVHWHGKHPSGMNNPTERNAERWRRCIDAAADLIAAMGIAVINASPISALVNYPKMGLLEALDADPTFDAGRLGRAA